MNKLPFEKKEDRIINRYLILKYILIVISIIGIIGLIINKCYNISYYHRKLICYIENLNNITLLYLTNIEN